MSIEPARNTLWEVAYGQGIESRDKDTPVSNLAADAIIKRSETNICISKVVLVVSSILIAIGLTIALFFALSSPSFLSASDAWAWVSVGVELSLLGAPLLALGIYCLSRSKKELEQYKTKPLLEIMDRLGKDLARIEKHHVDDVFKRKPFEDDWQRIFDAVQAIPLKS